MSLFVMLVLVVCGGLFASQQSSINFSGTLLQNISYEGDLGINGNEALSMEAWIEITEQPVNNNFGFIEHASKNGIDNYIGINYYDQDGVKSLRIITDYKASIYCNITLETNKWYHIEVTRDNAETQNYKLYLNGLEVASGVSNKSPINNNRFTIGSQVENINYSNMKVCQVRIWNVKRTATEIIANYKKELVGPIAGLVGYWPLNGDANDYSGNGNHLTAYGSPVYSDDVPSCFQVPDLENGLVIYYPLSGDAIDSSVNGNNGEVMNGAVSISDRNGIVNSAYHLDGNDDFIKIDNYLGTFTNFSINFWYKCGLLGETYQMIFHNGKTVDQNCNVYIYRNIDGRIIYATKTNNVWYPIYFNFDFIQNEGWHNLTITFNGSNVRLYSGDNLIEEQSFNYVLAASSNQSRNFLFMNANDDVYEGGFNGSVDDIRIYNRALSSQEIQLLATGEVVDTTNNQTATIQKIETITVPVAGSDPYKALLGLSNNNPFVFIKNYDNPLDTIALYNVYDSSYTVWDIDFYKEGQISVSGKKKSDGKSYDKIYDFNGVLIKEMEF